jgi:flagellar biosynthesis protein FlhB
MEIIFFIIIFGAGLVSGMYITSQIEKSIDKHIDTNTKKTKKKQKTMIEQAATLFGMVFMGLILVCLIWTILSYILETRSPKNKIEEHFKKYK